LSVDEATDTFAFTDNSKEGEYEIELTCTYSTTVATATQIIKIFKRVNSPPEFLASFED